MASGTPKSQRPGPLEANRSSETPGPAYGVGFLWLAGFCYGEINPSLQCADEAVLKSREAVMNEDEAELNADEVVLNCRGAVLTADEAVWNCRRSSVELQMKPC